MTHLRTSSLVAALIVLSSATACHAQKTTDDPNSALASKPAEVSLTDARLAKKITYEAWHTPVRTVLADLSKFTGVTLNAGYSKQDWQVRDRKMNIRVKDVTLAQLMNSIARVMKFKWSRNDQLTPPTYRLTADRKLLAALQAEASRLERELKAEEIRRRTGTVEALAKVADLSGPRLEALREDNPYLYQCATTGFAKMMTQLFADEPALREAFIKGNKTASVQASMFPQSTRHLCTETVRKCWPLDHVTSSREAVGDNYEEGFGGINLDWLTQPYERSKCKRLFYYGAMIAVGADGGRFIGDMRDPYAKASKAWGKACLDAVENGTEPGHSWSTVAPNYFPTEYEEAREIEPYLMFDPLVEHPDDPDLHKQISVKFSDEDWKALNEQVKAAGGRTWQRLVYQLLQKTIAEAAGMNVISDSYNVLMGRNMQSLPEKDETVVLLDKFTDVFRCNWEKHGCIIEFRRRDWFRMRSMQVPDEWLEAWHAELRKKSMLSLDSYIRMLALSEDQIEENVTSDFLLDQVAGPYRDCGIARSFCRFYVQLNSSERGMIFSEPGLDVRALNPVQWQYYSDMFEHGYQPRWHTEEFSSPGDATVKIRGASETKNDGSAAYKFTVHLTKEDGSADQQEWNINLRKIAQPKEKVP